MTRRLPLTSPHNGQLPSTHQSLSAENSDTQSLVEIILFDNPDNSTNLLMCIFSPLCPSAPISAILCGHFKTVKCTEYNFPEPVAYSVEHIHTGRVALIYRLIQISRQSFWLSFKHNYVLTALLLREAVSQSSIWKS